MPGALTVSSTATAVASATQLLHGCGSGLLQVVGETLIGFQRGSSAVVKTITSLVSRIDGTGGKT